MLYVSKSSKTHPSTTSDNIVTVRALLHNPSLPKLLLTLLAHNLFFKMPQSQLAKNKLLLCHCDNWPTYLSLNTLLTSIFLNCSANVFGVSAKSMRLSFDARGTSVPTILLLMQMHLYARGGLQAEGLFRLIVGNIQE